MSSERKIRVLIAKPGLDGHDRGAKVVARALRDAGMEVIYTGLYRSMEQIVNSAIQEDVDVIGLSILHAAHDTLVDGVIQLLKKHGATDVMLLVGGIVPKDEVSSLMKVGVAKVFHPETNTTEIVEFIRANVGRATIEKLAGA